MSRHSPDNRAGPPNPAFRFLSDAPPAHVRWLWPQRLPRGTLSLLVGDPGVGKSLLTVDLAARLSAAHPWPDDPDAERPVPTGSRSHLPTSPRAHAPAPSAGVLFAAPEDDAALADRLAAAGADLLCISVLDGVRPPFTQDFLPLRLPGHCDQLEQAIRAHDHPGLVVLDPIHRLLDDGVYASPDLQAGLLSGLASIAQRHGVALLAVGHFTKTYARRVFYRIRGALSLVAAARSILLITADPDDPDRRILTQVKNAYAPLAAPLAFHIVPGPRLDWDDPTRADWRLATGVLDLSPESLSVLSETCDWLTDLLSAGPCPAREVLAAARAAGIPRVTLFRAKRLLSIPSRKHAGGWAWLSVPSAAQESLLRPPQT